MATSAGAAGPARGREMCTATAALAPIEALARAGIPEACGGVDGGVQATAEPGSATDTEWAAACASGPAAGVGLRKRSPADRGSAWSSKMDGL